MGTITIESLTGGLDTRRITEASEANVLLVANNGHITRGGDFEKRFSFVDEYDLPAGTVGLSANSAGLVVFGHTTAPGGIPVGVAYQRLEHPDTSSLALVRVLSSDLYQGKVYAVAEFEDGSIHHYYDGVNVDDWYDGRARASFEVTGGVDNPAVAAAGAFEIVSGTNNPANTITAVRVAGVNTISAPVQHDGDNATTATAVAAAITSHTSTPNYTATAAGAVVTITAATPGAAANGRVVSTEITGDFATDNETPLAGGANAVVSQVTDIQVNSISIINAPVEWDTSNTDTAAAIAAAINGFTSTPDYTATSVGTRVNIVADDPGAAPNGFTVDITTADGFAIDPATGLTMAGGSDATETYQPGTFVKTIASKMYSVSGPNMHFSGIQQPTQWTTDAVGAGFIDLSSESAGFEELVSLARYQNFVAAFAERGIQVWFVDPDPALYRITQTLNNTGTASANSVTQFGDEDVFYLDESGLRSLRSRASINIASTTDIGVPVDELVTAKLRELSDAERDAVYGLIEPASGRFWLIMKDTIFVFSFFQSAQVSAWSTYTTTDADGEPFDVSSAIVFGRRVYLRSGDTIYCYGGAATGRVLDDATEADVWSPYLDANKPTEKKQWTGIDVSCRGEWRVFAGMQPREDALDVEDEIGRVWETTFNADRIPFHHASTHASLRFRSVGGGEHKIGQMVLHYSGDFDED